MSKNQEISWVHTQPGHISLPVSPRVQHLPLHDLGWQSFERLCTRVAKRRADAGHCQAFGVPGQEQDGIDLYFRRKSNGRYTVWQCKCVESVSPSELKAIVDKFLEGDWPGKTDEFCLVTSANLTRTELSNAEQVQAERLRLKGIDFTILDVNGLSDELKGHPDLVDDFFPAWLEAFCGPEAARVLAGRRKLTPAQVSELRRELLQLYQSYFESADPGLPTILLAGGAGEGTSLPLKARYEPVDIIERRDVFTARFTTPQPRQSNSFEHGDISGSKPAGNATEKVGTWESTESRTRSRIFEWVTASDKNLLLGDAGSGKSATVRFLLLDLLSDYPVHPELAAKWAARLPVYVPFATWVRMVADGRSHHSLQDVLNDWLHNVGAHQPLIDLVAKTLEDDRLLLIVDGLDEWNSESAAVTALALLNTFIQKSGTPCIATSRRLVYDRLAANLGSWRIGEIAGLDSNQQRQLASRWFVHRLGDSLPTRQQIDNFFRQLRRDGALGHLAETPLLLSGLVALSLAGWQLPRNRFLAYEQLTALLIEIHPRMRGAAALSRERGALLRHDEVERVLARLAFETQQSPEAVSIQKDAAREIASAHLVERLRVEAPEASRLATELLVVSADSLGIVVEKSNERIGFVHRVFQEFLAARHISRQSYVRQRELLQKFGQQHSWHGVLLCTCHLTTREEDVDGFVDDIEAADASGPARFHRERLLAEIAFANLNLSPARARHLANRAFKQVESGWWLPLRRLILDLVIDGLSSEVLRNTIAEKLGQWFPARCRWGWGVCDAMAAWEFEQETVETLLRIIESTHWEFERVAAARAIAKHGRGRLDVAERLVVAIQTPNTGEASAAHLFALAEGWPNFPKTNELLESSAKARHRELQLVGLIGLAKLGRRETHLREALIGIVRAHALEFWSWNDAIVDALLSAWHKDADLKRAAIESLRESWNERRALPAEIAAAFLIRGFPNDAEVAELFAELFRTERESLIFHPWHLNKQFMDGFRGNELLKPSIEDWVEKQKWSGPELYHAALIAHSPRVKADLLRRLKDGPGDDFWVIDALVDGWGNDLEVAAALTSFAERPNVDDGNLADSLLNLPIPKSECRRRLLAALSSTSNRRKFSVIEGLGKLGCEPDDLEVVNAVLASACPPAGPRAADLESERGAIIKYFSSNSRVRDFAFAEVFRRDAQLGAVAAAFGGDERARKAVRSALNALPAALRLHLIERLETAAFSDDIALGLLSQCHGESDRVVGVVAVAAYYGQLHARNQVSPTTLEHLANDLTAVGHNYEDKRLAAFVALAGLERLDIVKGNEPFREDPVKVWLEHSDTAKPEVFKALGLRWPALFRTFGDTLTEEFHFKGAAVGVSLAYIEDESSFAEVLRIWETQPQGSRSGHTALRAVGARLPGTTQLRKLCLSLLAAERGDGNWGEISELIIAGELLGEQFGGDLEIRAALETQFRSRLHLDAAVVALCIGWKDSLALDEPLSEKEFNRLRLPAQVHLGCRNLPPKQLLDALTTVLGQLTGSIWEFLPNILPPLLKRFSSDQELRALAVEHILAGATPDEIASFPKILARTGGLDPRLEVWSNAQLKALEQSPGLPLVGFDLLAGRLNAVRVSLTDALMRLL